VDNLKIIELAGRSRPHRRSSLYAVTVTDAQLAAAEQAYLDARDRHDRATIAEAQGKIRPGLRTDAAAAATTARGALAAVVFDPTWSPDDARAYRVMARWAAQDPENAGNDRDDDGYEPGEGWAVTAERGFAALSARIDDEYARAQGAVDIGDLTLTRLGVLDRLGIEADPDRRRRLFYALESVWRTIDADGGPASPYQRLLPLSADRWARDGSPLDRSAAAMGLTGANVEAHLIAILETWRDAVGARKARIEPWDWWYETGAASRALRAAAPLDRIRELSIAYHASLGADPLALGVGFDLFPRFDRPPVPVAYTDFGGRPRILADGARRPAQAWVMATYTIGGLGELTELMHECGHAIHLAAIDTRPAFADWPDGDAFTEALAELTALDTAEPSWQAHWLGASVPEPASLRSRYADVMLDVCWALFEIRLHADPEQDPNDVWADLTSTYLGIEPHAEVSWWAMRGQLVQEPGYMVNYALAAIIAADLRAGIRAARGDWSTGDPGWYEWVSARIYRWGLERSSRDVLVDVLGRTPTADALTAEIGRSRGH
jgi:hypothetical protein